MSRKRRQQPPVASPAAALADPAPKQRHRAAWAGAALLVIALLAWAGWHAFNAEKGPAPEALAPTAVPSVAAAAPAPAAYVDNASCLGCHRAQAEAWRSSHHALAMALPDEHSVRGDFDNARFTHHGVTTRFFRRDGKYFVNAQGPDGRYADFEVRYTFGIDPLQQYLLATEGGRLQALTVAWDTRDKHWFPLMPDEKTPPGDVLHWSGRYMTGNTMCIACHTTDYDKRYDAATDTFDSRWAAADVSCQACHGPGERHLDWARAKAEGKPIPNGTGAHHGLSVNTGTASPEQTVQLCAACHSRRSELTARPAPGEPLLDHYLPSLLREGLYHADGQQLDEVYVYGSFRQSKMYAAGVSCTNCHDAHTAKPKLPGNALCLQCHGEQPNPSFAQAAGPYDSPSHHHHAQGSAGAQCTACHMPAKNFMQIQSRPDHSLRVPRPDLSVKLGTPNACNDCHADRSAQWAADAVSRWFATPKRPPHFGEVFAAARRGAPDAAPALVALLADAAEPAIVRATALELLHRYPGAGIDTRIAATQDKDGEVRAAAAASLDDAPAAQRVPALGPLLDDPLRAVRIAAARSLSSLPVAQFEAPRRAAFDAALAEYVAAQNVALDMPGPNLNLGVLYDNLGRAELSEQHYQRALKIDPDFTPARANLARFYSAHGRNADAERVLRDGVARLPDQGELQYSLGLLLAEGQRLPEAVQALQQAAKLLPTRPRVQYNLGLALQQSGQTQAAEAALKAAQGLDASEAAYPYALAVLYAQTGQTARALVAAQRLAELRPNDPQVRQMLSRLRGETR